MLDDADMGAPQARRRAGGLALQDADLARLAAQRRGRIGRDVGVIACSVDPVTVGLAGQRLRW